MKTNMLSNFEPYDYPLFNYVRLPAVIIEDQTKKELGLASEVDNYEVLRALVWEGFKKKVPKGVIRSVEKLVKRQSNQAPVWLSDSEYKFAPVTVALLGNGSNEKGSNILRRGIKNIRKHKSGKGDGLPPKAKPLLSYMSLR